jgi:hypothetical protein
LLLAIFAASLAASRDLFAQDRFSKSLLNRDDAWFRSSDAMAIVIPSSL